MSYKGKKNQESLSQIKATALAREKWFEKYDGELYAT